MSDEATRRWLSGWAWRARGEPESRKVANLVAQEVGRAVPEIAADAELSAQTVANSRTHWRALLSALVADEFQPHPPAPVLERARGLARQEIPLATLLKAYRVGQRVLWNHVVATFDAEIPDAALRSAVLVRFWDRATQWLDVSVDAIETAYAEEWQQWQRAAPARRAETVHALLRGETFDLDEAAALLGHDLNPQQTAFVLWTDREDLDTAALVRRAGTLARSLGAGAALTVAAEPAVLWAWVATPHRPDVAALDTAELRAAVGTSAPGLEGFRRSHREAQAARRIALRGAQRGGLTRYDEVELVCLVTGDGSLEAVRALVDRELGELASPSPSAARLRDTVLTVLAGGGNVAAAAETLGVHANTVRYRIQQAEQLLGHPIDQRRTHVELALRCLASYGPDRLLH